MSLRDTIRVVQPGRRRIKIFIDFWNVVINARKQTTFDIDVVWNSLADQIVQETHRGYGDDTSGELAGCYIFGSYSKSSPKENDFVNKTLDKYGHLPGLFFEFKERVRKETSIKCNSCGDSISRATESGVDVLLAVETIKHMTMREHDFLAVVSSDQDFIPLLSYLKDQGQRVIHVATGDTDRVMRSLTWKQVELKSNYYRICSLSDEYCIVLTSPHYKVEMAKAYDILTAHNIKPKVIDITVKEEINDKDLDFLISRFSIYFEFLGDSDRSYNPRSIFSSLHEFRKALSEGKINAPLPYIIRNGQMEAHRHDRWGWMVNGSPGVLNAWRGNEPD